MATIITPELLQSELTLHDLILPETVWNVIAFELEQVQKTGRPFRNTLALTGTGGLGKAQPLDASVLTPHGFVAMKDLKIGDEIIDPEGEKSFIEGIFPRGKMDVYKISFSDGSSCEATMDHLWKARTDETTHGWQIMSTRQMFEHRMNNGKKRKKTIAIPLFRPKRHLEKTSSFKNNPKLGNRSLPVKYLRDIELIGNKTVQCIKVSAKSSLYITDGYTVTHNTSLGLAIARQLDMAKVIIVTNRPSKTEVREILSEIEDETMLLLDEIHGYAKQEWLLDVCYGARGLGRKVNFTVFGATTNRGQLPQTVFSRFPIKLFLTYTREEEALIADKVAERFSVTLSMSEKDTLLKAANGNPRTMETILGFWPVGEPEKAVEMAQLTPDGLDADCIALLDYLDSKRDAVGRETLSRVLEAPGGIADIETILSRRKLIEPTPRGLKITTRGTKRMRYRRDTGI